MATPIELRYNLNRFSAGLSRFAQQYLREADRVVFEVATNVKADIQQGWPVDQGVSRAAWNGPVKIEPAHYQLTNPLPYSAVIEFGGYPGVGPKTEHVGGQTLPGGIQVDAGIFPTQVPAAPVRRALSKNRKEIPRKLAEAQKRLGGR